MSRDEEPGRKVQAMECTAYSVLPVENGWVIEQENARLGPYPSEAIAVRVAIAEAVQRREQNQPVRASVYDRGGNVSAAYCLCKDFKIAIL